MCRYTIDRPDGRAYTPTMSLAGVRSASLDQGAAALDEVERGFDELDFRRAMGRFPTGVTVVTMLGRAGEAYGVTVNAFMSVSLEPPLIAVSLGMSARAHPTMSASERFAVSVLAEDQRDLSDLFAGRRSPSGEDPFVSFRGFPVIAGAVAHVLCRMHSRFDAGDHTIFVGEVEALRTSPGAPLVFHRGRYGALDSAAEGGQAGTGRGVGLEPAADGGRVPAGRAGGPDPGPDGAS